MCTRNFSKRSNKYGFVICSVLLLGSIGCSRPAGPARAAVSGEVIFNHQPLESGRITFVPVDGTQGPTAIAVVTDGFYQFDRRNGPVIGKNRIQIESLPDPGFELDDEEAYAKAMRDRKGLPVLPREQIPPEYNQRSTLVEEVFDDGELQIDFSLEQANARHTL